MKKLCVFTLYADKGASSQYRAYIYKEKLEKKFHVKWFYFWDNTYATKYMHNKKKYCIQILFQFLISAIMRWTQLTFIATKADIVFIQKGIIPKIKKTFLNRLRKKGIRIVFDVDDAIYLDKSDNSDDIAKLSDCVICGNRTLKKHYRKVNPNCFILPTIENTNRYKKYWKDTFDHKVIGWIGSKTTIRNLELIVNPLNNLMKKYPEIQFYIISNDAFDYLERIENCHFIRWNKEKYIQDISKFTIGIMPLEQNEYNKGKCGFKLIQYVNMKKPIVGTPIGVNSEILAGNGITANSEQEWEEAIEKLLYNREIYNKCVEHIEYDLFKKYNFDNSANQLIDILNKN